MFRHSPHYSPKPNPKCSDSRSDARITAALSALRHVASFDPDGARLENDVGFSRSDVARGHRLAAIPVALVKSSPRLAAEVLAMAARYRRQVPGMAAFQAGLTDQRSLW